MAKSSDFLISNEASLSKRLRDTTNKRGDAFVWGSEPSIGAMNYGMPDLNVALDGMIYPVELKVRSARARLEPTPGDRMLRINQIRFMYRLNAVGVYTYIGLGYIGTDIWYLMPVWSPDGIVALPNGDVIKSVGVYDLAEVILLSLKKI